MLNSYMEGMGEEENEEIKKAKQIYEEWKKEKAAKKKKQKNVIPDLENINKLKESENAKNTKVYD